MKRLSENENKVLTLMTMGLKNREIAKKMKTRSGDPLSEKTVSTYGLRIRDKLGVPQDKNVHFLITVAIYKGIVKPVSYIDYLDNLEVDGVDTKDYPKFCDAFFSSGEIDGRSLTEDELDELGAIYPEALNEMAMESLR